MPILWDGTNGDRATTTSLNGIFVDTTCAFSACGWMTGNTSTKSPFGIGNGSNLQFELLRRGATNDLNAFGYATSAIFNNLALPADANEWWFWGFAISGTAIGSATLYLWTQSNGWVSSANVVALQVLVAPTLMSVGSGPIVTTEAWVGRTLGFRVWNAVLTAAEIYREKQSITPRRIANLTHGLPMIGPDSAATLRDLKGNVWTPTGTVTYTNAIPAGVGYGAKSLFVNNSGGTSLSPWIVSGSGEVVLGGSSSMAFVNAMEEYYDSLIVDLDPTTLVEVLAAQSINDKITVLKAAMGTGTQTVSIKDVNSVERLTGTFSGGVYSDTTVNFLPSTLLGSVTGSGGTPLTGWKLRVTNSTGRWFEADFGSERVWNSSRALSPDDSTYLSLNLGWEASTSVPITESMARWYWDPTFTFSETTLAKRNVFITGHLAAVYGNQYNCVVSAIPNTGLVDPYDTKNKLVRVPNGSSYSWRSVLSKGQPLDAFSSHRMQFYPNFGNVEQQIPHGEEVWIAFAFKSPAITTANSGAIGGISTSVSGDSGVYFYFGSSTGQISIESWFNTTPDGPRTAARDSVTGTVNSPSQLYSVPVPRSTWMHYVIKARLSYQLIDNPYLQVWQKIGSGLVEKVVDNTLRNAWDTPTGGQWSFPKVGQYYFAGYGDPWNGAPDGTNQTLDYAGCVAVPVSAAAGADYTDFMTWLMQRTAAT